MIDIGLDLSRAKAEYYESVEDRIKVLEESSEGRAELTLVFPPRPDKQRIRLLKEHDAWLQYAKVIKCTDGVVIEYDPDQKLPAAIYIFELKRSIAARTWEKVKTQFEGAGLRALAFCSTVGIQPGEFYFHTAYLNDRTVQAENEILKKQQNLRGPIASKALLGLNKQEIQEWNQDSVKPFKGSTVQYEHRHIVLEEHDSTGIGEFHVRHD